MRSELTDFALPAAAAGVGGFLRIAVDSSGRACIADGSEKGIGVGRSVAHAIGENVPIRLFADGGICPMRIDGNGCAVGNRIYPSRDGLVSNAGTERLCIGFSRTARPADHMATQGEESLIEVILI
jgi:hypothetical protein